MLCIQLLSELLNLHWKLWFSICTTQGQLCSAIPASATEHKATLFDPAYLVQNELCLDRSTPQTLHSLVWQCTATQLLLWLCLVFSMFYVQRLNSVRLQHQAVSCHWHLLVIQLGPTLHWCYKSKHGAVMGKGNQPTDTTEPRFLCSYTQTVSWGTDTDSCWLMQWQFNIWIISSHKSIKKSYRAAPTQPQGH